MGHEGKCLGVFEKDADEESVESDDDWVMVEGTGSAPGNLTVVYPITNTEIKQEDAVEPNDEATDPSDTEEEVEIANVGPTRTADSFTSPTYNEERAGGGVAQKSYSRKALERSNKCFEVQAGKKNKQGRMKRK